MMMPTESVEVGSAPYSCLNSTRIAPRTQCQPQARWLDRDSLADRIQAWDDLAANALWRSPGLEPNYLLPALNHLDPNIRVLVIEDASADAASNIIGLAPIMPTRKFRLPFRCAEVWKHEQCFDSTPLLHHSHAQQAWQTLCQELIRSGFDMLSLDTVTAEPDFETILSATAEDLQFARFTRANYQRAAFRPSPDFDQYRSRHVSKSVRKSTARQLRRLSEKGEVHWERSNPESDFDNLASQFMALEASGWKGREGTAIQSQPRTRDFYRELVQRSAAAGKARFLTLSFNSQPIAMISDLQSGDTVYSYKTAYDESFAEFSPGVQLEVKNLEFLHEDGIRFGDSCTLADNATINRIWGQKVGFQDTLFSLRPGLNRFVTRLLPAARNLARKFRQQA